MIDAEQFNRIEDVVNGSVQKLRENIIELMVQRIMSVRYDTLIESNRFLTYKLQSSGMLLNDIIKEIAKRTGKSRETVRKIFEDSYVQSVKYDNSIYEEYGIEPLPYTVSPQMLKVLDDAMRQTNGELTNMTRTLADSTQRSYLRLLDEAYMKVHSGSFSYNQAISDVVSEAIKDSAYIFYPSGHRDRIEVAARRAVLCGVNQSSIRAAVERCRERGWNHICVSSHLGARTCQKGKPLYADHSGWQGKIYWLDRPDGERESFVDICGWGHGDGIGGWGCRHSAFAWVEGMGNPFKEYNSEENRKRYELVSKQRAKERRIRETKIALTGLRKAIDSAENQEMQQALQDKYDKKALKLRQYNKDYKKYCEENDLKPYQERLKTAEWNAKESKRAVLAANREIKAESNKTEKCPAKQMRMEFPEDVFRIKGITSGVKTQLDIAVNKLQKEYDIRLDTISVEPAGKGDVFVTGWYNGRMGMVINENADFDKIIRRIPDKYITGYFAEKSLQDYIAHEMFHVMCYQDCENIFKYNARYAQIEALYSMLKGISGYADKTQSGNEALAEAFVRMRNKEEVPELAKVLIETYIGRWKK